MSVFLPYPPFVDGILFTIKVISNQNVLINLYPQAANFYSASNASISQIKLTSGYGSIFSANNNWYITDCFFKNSTGTTITYYSPQLSAPEYVLGPEGYYDFSNNIFMYYDLSSISYVLVSVDDGITYPDTAYPDTYSNNIYLDNTYNAAPFIDLGYNDTTRATYACMIIKNINTSLDIYGYGTFGSSRLINLYDNVNINNNLYVNGSTTLVGNTYITGSLTHGTINITEPITTTARITAGNLTVNGTITGNLTGNITSSKIIYTNGLSTLASSPSGSNFCSYSLFAPTGSDAFSSPFNLICQDSTNTIRNQIAFFRIFKQVIIIH